MGVPAQLLDLQQFRLLDWTATRPKPSLVPDPPSVEKPVEPAERLRGTLDAGIAAKLLNGTELIRALARQRREESIPTTITPFDALLGGGLPRGKMIELAGRRAAGRYSLVLASLAAATSMGEAAVLVDLGDGFDPQLAEANGADLRRLLWVRPRKLKEAVMAVEMLTAAGFQLVALDAGPHSVKGRVPDAAWVRLGRAADAHGAAMLVSTPYPLTGTASEAVVAVRRARARWLGRGDAPRVLAGMEVEMTLEKHRHMRPGAKTAVFFPAWEAVR